MITEIKTAFSKIGQSHPTYLIAEIGSNHNGSFDQACEMIEVAADAGVDAVKFQTFKAKNHYSKNTPGISLYNKGIYELIEELEIDRSWHTKLAALSKKVGVDFLDSPCDFEAVDLAIKVDMPLMKVASFDMVDVRLIDRISKTGKGVIFSTGMANMSEIETAVNICRKNNNEHIIILQCTSIYPAPVHLSNLNAMETVKRAFGVLVGYSDHTLGDHIACAAVSMGAEVIEKHFTLDRDLEGPDHAFAIEPQELGDMVSKIRDIELGMGDGIKNGPRPEEMEFYEKARRSIIAKRNISKGEAINNDNIIIKRPGNGIHPSYLDVIIGRIATKNIKIDTPITWDSL
ncbi:MAG: N-acetylneuraminate synthase family protein [Bacteroidota bacterium]